jgi:hypothetical protein
MVIQDFEIGKQRVRKAWISLFLNPASGVFKTAGYVLVCNVPNQ